MSATDTTLAGSSAAPTAVFCSQDAAAVLRKLRASEADQLHTELGELKRLEGLAAHVMETRAQTTPRYRQLVLPSGWLVLYRWLAEGEAQPSLPPDWPQPEPGTAAFVADLRRVWRP